MKIYKLSFLTLLIFISITNPSLTCDEPDGYGDMPASSSPTSAPVAASRSQTMTAGDALLELPPSFLQLGRDPSILVMRYLPLGDAISLSQTCKSLNRYFKNPLVQKRFGSPFNNDRELKDAFSRLGNIFRKKAGSIASALFTKTPHLYGHMLNRLLSCGRTFGFLQPMSALRMFLWGFANIELCEERKRSASFSSQLEDAFFKTPLEKLRPAISHTIGLYREYKFFGFNHGNTVQALGKLSPEQMSLLCRAAPKIFNQLLHTSNFGYGEDLTVSALCSIPFEVALKICDTEPSFLLGAIRKEKKSTHH